MASLVLGVVGRAVAGPFGGFVGGLIGGYIDQQLFGEDRVLEGPRLNNLQVSSSAYGNPIRILYGRMRLGGNVVWSPGIKEHRVEESQGGKGGGPSATSVSYLYTASFRIGLCEGPAAAILRVWADGKLIADLTGGTGPAYSIKITGAENGLIGSARFYPGSETQEADPAEQADRGVANTPAYRGQVGIVFEDFPLEDYGNRIPQITAEVAISTTDAFPIVSSVATSAGVLFLRLALWTRDRRSLITVSTKALVSRWDAINQKQIYNKLIVSSYTPSVDKFGYPAIDSQDFVYVGGDWKITVADGTIYKVNSRTGEVIDQTALGAATFGNNDVEDMIVGGLPPSDNYLTVLSSGDDIATVRTSDMVVVNLYTLGLAAIINVGMAVDEAGFVWVLFTDLSDGILVKFSPTTGLALQTFTLTGESDAEFMTYVSERNALVFQSDRINGTFKRFDIASGTVDATVTINKTLASGRANAMIWRNGPTDGRLWLQGPGNASRLELDFVAMAFIREVITTDWDPTVIAHVQYDAINHALIGQETPAVDPIIWHWKFLDRKAGAPVALSTIVEDISSRVGLNIAGDVDAAALTDSVIGFAIDRQMPARRALEPLATAYLFDAREEDSKAQFVKRGGLPVATIPRDDLAARASGQEGFVPRVAEERLREIDLPRRIDMTYLDPSIDFQSNVQGFQRIQEAVSTRTRLRMEMPIAFDNDEAARRIEQIGFLIWQARSRYDIKVSRKHIRPSPGDVITVLDGAASFTLRLERAELAPGGLISFQGVSEDAALYSSFATGADALGVPTQSIVVAGASTLYLMDIPLLRDADEGLGIYLASGAGGDEAWPGAAIFKSADGFDFSSRLTFVTSDRNVAHGFAETILGDDGARNWDRTNTVTLRLFRGALSSSTRPGVLNGANAVLLGDEVVQFVNATLNADGSYTLDTLLRGRRGTEWATGSHKAGERAVVLSASHLLKIPVPDSDLKAERFHKAVTVGGSLSGATQESLTLKGRVLMPYAPVHIFGKLTFGDWEIFWRRRTRLGGAWKDGVDVPLGEDSEAYEVDILDPGSPSGEVMRILSTTTEQVNYSSAQQIADFGAEQSSLMVRVYQLSATVGRGFPGVATLAG